MLLWKELGHCSLVEDGRKCVSRCRCMQSFCVHLFSFNTYRRTAVVCEKCVRREGRVWLQTRFGNSICYQILLFILDHKLGPIGSGKSSTVLVISPMVFLMVDQAKKLWDLNVKVSIFSSSTGTVARATGNQFKSPAWYIASCSVHLILSWRVDGGWLLRIHYYA